ncbi:hypothetical protein [Amycolatopsis sp. CA-126428]|uniref:hypothetical protein n=1 Tax=Amycolatopsis sp. CA-126428 TaxID=2073158 RepID=UPI000CCFD4C6|nr:hypothetical protein [Amycolatopsis sp. CA-126428]
MKSQKAESSDDYLVFDTSPLAHFAQRDILGVLKIVAGTRRVLIPDMVAVELGEMTVRDERIKATLNADWIEQRELRTVEEVSSFAEFSSLLVRGTRNRGEAAVLALTKSIGDAWAVIDDGAGRRAAHDNDINLKPTLALLCEAINQKLLTIGFVSAMVDELLLGKYRLPLAPGGFEAWARENDIIQV